ncbi:basal body-orientation factor 1 [Pelodytes ibericus]
MRPFSLPVGSAPMKKKFGKGDRVDRESEVERAKANAALWEARLKVTEFSRVEYREAVRSLAQNNEELTKNQYQLEKDMVDVIGFLKKQDLEKDDLIENLKQELLAQRKCAEDERERLMEIHNRQITELEERYSQKVSEIRIIQEEYKMMREFRRQKMEMENELEELKESLRKNSQNHKQAVSKLERRFFEEKQRLEAEAEKKIMKLAHQAHSEAVMQLDEAGRAVFKENVRLKEAFSYHLTEMEESKKTKEKLESRKSQLLQEKETNELLVKEKVLQAAQKNAQIRELQKNVKMLEGALEQMTLDVESRVQRKEHDLEAQEGNMELKKLQKVLQVKEQEMNRVKKLARNILDERTDVERFFLEALTQVKEEIMSSRSYYRKVSQTAYNSKMKLAVSQPDQYPKIRTFHNKEHSTNDVDQDLLEAEKWSHVRTGKVDMGDLTWEQKEQVLRLLFAKMNGFQPRKKSPSSLGSLLKAEREERCRESEKPEGSCTIFITQQDPELPVPTLVLPGIHTGRCQVMG